MMAFIPVDRRHDVPLGDARIVENARQPVENRLAAAVKFARLGFGDAPLDNVRRERSGERQKADLVHASPSVCPVAKGRDRMSRKLLQAGLAAAMLAACQSQGSAQSESSGPRPFTITEIAEFSTPWAMAFLPGSGVPLTNMALLTEKEGRLWLVDVGSGKRTSVSGVPQVVV